MLDDHHWFAPYVEVYASEKLFWVRTGAARHYVRFPEIDEYSTLIAEYQVESEGS